MTSRIHPGNPTQPLKAGAPLPTENMLNDIPPITSQDVSEELQRARVELLYACARHRKAWAKMLDRKNERDLIEKRGSVGALPTLESDAIWKIRVSDVKFWCAEMTAQAAAVTALTSMHASFTPPPVPRETTIFGWNTNGSQAPTERQYRTACSWRDQLQDGRLHSVAEVEAVQALIDAYDSRHPQPRATEEQANVRMIVLGWDPARDPTKREYDVACAWINMAGGKGPLVGAADRAKIDELVRRYEQAHPEIFPPK